MNLENLGLVELNAQEVQEVEGGIVGIDDVCFGIALVIMGGCVADWSGFKSGFMQAFN